MRIYFDFSVCYRVTFVFKMPPKRKTLTLKEKISVLNFHENKNYSVRSLARHFGIGKTQAAEIIKQKDILLKKWHSNVNINAKRSFLSSKGKSIDELCFEWFVKTRSKGIPLSGLYVKVVLLSITFQSLGPLIQNKAKEIAAEIGAPNFSASSGWLEKFRKRHCISFKSISGEAASVNMADVSTFLDKVSSIVAKYSPKDIYNIDETGLFFRALPSKTMHLKKEKCIGGKLSKERVTILHCVNMAGEKEKLLVIGKAAKPRAFKNISINELPVTWKSNHKAWMTGQIMMHWLKELDRKLEMQKRKILLFLDNAACHPKDAQLNNIQLVFFPPNCTSVCQPLDQGIIKSFKTFYRSFIVKDLLVKIDSTGSGSELTRSINVLDAIFFYKKCLG